MVQHIDKGLDAEKESRNKVTSFKRQLSQEWIKLKLHQRLGITGYCLFSFASLMILQLKKGLIQKYFQYTVNNIEHPYLYQLVDRIANLAFNGTIKGGITLHNVKTVYPLFVFFWGSLLLLAFMIMISFVFPDSIRLLSGYSTKEKFVSDLKTSLQIVWIYPASITLGLSINNRSLSLTAGLFVLIYMWDKRGLLSNVVD